MNVTINEETDTQLHFDIEDTSPAFANALRRTMMGNIPTLAVEHVTVTKNSSGIFDEMLAHRLGLLPWNFPTDKYRFREDCDCEDGCPKCTVSMALQKEGPGPVTASDIAVGDDEVEPANPDALIIELNDDTELELEMTAQLGRGADHAKWQAANAAYGYEEDDTSIHFQVETVSGMEPRQVVAAALTQLEDDLDRFEDSLNEAL